MIVDLGKGKARLIVNIGSGEHRKRRVKTVEYKTKRELRRMYDDFEDEVKGNLSYGMTVKNLIDNYIAKKKALGIKATTLKGYEVCAQRLDASIGRISADSLTTYQLENFIAQNVNNGVDGKPKYSAKTLANTIGLLSSAYEDAIRTGRLNKNPCKNVSLPKKTKKEILVFSEDEVVKFLEALRNERIDFRVGYEFCLLCGMRRSEVLGLKASDINLADKTVSIAHTRHWVYGETVEQGTKTTRSHRTLALPDLLIQDLKELFEERKMFLHPKSEYIIQDGFGNAINPSSFTNRIGRIERENGLPMVTVHGLRHTFASMLNSEQIDIARISAELGHANISTTLNIYMHVFGNTTASSRGIANTINAKLDTSAINVPQESKEKTAEY